MATLKLRKPVSSAGPGPAPKRAPVRGQANRQRPTLKEAQALRAERERRAPPERRDERDGREPRDIEVPRRAHERRDPQASRDLPQRGRTEGSSQPPEPGQVQRHRQAQESQPGQDSRRDPGPRPAHDRGRGEGPWNARASIDERARRSPREDRPGRPDPSAGRASPERRADRRRQGAEPQRDPRTVQSTGRETGGPFHPGKAATRQTPHRAPPSARETPDRARPSRRDAPDRARPSKREAPDHPTRPSPPARHEASRSAPAPADPSLRLSKRMSQLGIASRREADEWIAKGWVRVDGRVVAELGSRVLPEQHITVDAKARREQDARVTVLVNKPVGYVSGQAEDGYEPALVLVKPENQWREDGSGTRFVREHLRSLVPAGRLDIDSVGLLVLTQDGRVARQLIGDDSAIEKEYLVRVAPAEGRPVDADLLDRLRHGLELDGEALRPAQVEWVNEDQLRFVLTQGKKRQIRRMCELVGLQVLGLKRVRIGAVMLGDLPPGQWRYLRSDETFAPR
jgi:23S rRNA pseudouridine2604 synthase